MKIQNNIEVAGRLAYSEAMAKQKYTGVYKKQGRWFIAWVTEMPGANTQGRTLKEARDNLNEALALLIGGKPTISSFKEHPIEGKRISAETP